MKLDLITNKAEKQGEVNPNDALIAENTWSKLFHNGMRVCVVADLNKNENGRN